MKRSRAASELKETHFDNVRLTRLGIEPMTLAELCGRVTARSLAAPERVDFYMLLLVTSGTGKHTVDFVDWPVSAGSLLFVRPGQVQQWYLPGGIEGQLVLIAPSALHSAGGRSPTRESRLLALDEWPSCTRLSSDLVVEVTDEMFRLRRDFDCFDQSDLGVALIRHLLLCLLLRLTRWCAAQSNGALVPNANRTMYRMFVRELEASFRERHGVRQYAERLGYSESTISRACLAAEGRSAKLVIDRRVALEAERLLVHSEATVAEIGHQLGFSEPTNFVKFFGRMIGTTPAAFRQSVARADGR